MKHIKRIGTLSLLSAVLLLSGCDMALMNPKGAIGTEQKTLILIVLGLMLIVLIPVILMVIVFAYRYRESNTKVTYRPNQAHSNKIELVVLTVPIIIIVILATITWKTTHKLDPYKPLVSTEKPITIEVISMDWKQLFVYPEQVIATINELAVPTNVPVNFKITSDSVMNSFFIPRLGGQIYAIAGMQTIHLIANESGDYEGMSASYSGHGFSDMKFTAIATPDRAGFDTWIEKVKQSSNTLDTMAKFDALAKPSQKNPAVYYSSVKPKLFQEIISKFGHTGHGAHGTNHTAAMNMNMSHAAHAGAAE